MAARLGQQIELCGAWAVCARWYVGLPEDNGESRSRTCGAPSTRLASALPPCCHQSPFLEASPLPPPTPRVSWSCFSLVSPHPPPSCSACNRCSYISLSSGNGGISQGQGWWWLILQGGEGPAVQQVTWLGRADSLEEKRRPWGSGKSQGRECVHRVVGRGPGQ